jgi:DNA segregation ATPase FtsK/SpoIIIE, S-DNA-T family
VRELLMGAQVEVPRERRGSPDGAARWTIVVRTDDETVTSTVPVAERLVVGRGSGVDLLVPDASISRRHFQLEAADGLELRDLGSAGGTCVNGVTVHQATLHAGDRITAGATQFDVLRLQSIIEPVRQDALEVAFYDHGQVRERRAVDRALVVGRDAACDIVVLDRQVSRRHLEVQPSPSGVLLKDLGAANGSEVNGRRLTGIRSVGIGDRIQLPNPEQFLAIESATVDARPIAIEVEDQAARVSAVEVDVGLDATVRDVARRLAEYVGSTLGAQEDLTVCRPDDGLVFHPENRWVDAGVVRGDHLLLLPLEGQIPNTAASQRPSPSRVSLSRLPRSAVPPERERVAVPRPPDSQSLRGRGITWQIVGGAGIVIAGLLIAFVRPHYALFALVGGLVALVSISAAIFGEQSRRKHAVRRFRDQLVTLDTRLLSVRENQADQLNSASPAPEVVVDWIEGRGRRLWERRPQDPDFLRLRIGHGRHPALMDIDGDTGLSEGALHDELQGVLDRHRELDDVPILGPSPRDAQVIGVVGPRKHVVETATWMLLQAAALHAPAELEIDVPAITRDWLWTRWLPHVEDADGPSVTWRERDAVALARRLRGQLELADETSQSIGSASSRLVLVPHGAQEALSEVLGVEWSSSTQFLVLADDASELPSRVDAIIEVDRRHGRLSGPPDQPQAAAFSLDRMSHDDATRCARSLGRYVDDRKPPPAASGQLGLLDLFGASTPAQVDVASLWATRPDEPLSAVVGVTLEQDPLALGFRSDGVHGVIGGTTGSGKSEFLQTLLVSLALGHRPSDLAFFLIDFKGGATFAALAELPHVVGVVTDLEQDGSLASRAFTALEAEMARRKRLLDQARVPNLVEYELLPEAKTEPLPALLVVIDEFALLVQQHPEAKERLDLVAAQGRSLGVHLLLATQSPSNAISPAIRSNTHLWISLRVVDDGESMELLGQRDAARIPSDRPGRAYVRFGGGRELVGFQTARIARPIGAGAGQARVTVRPFADDAPQRPKSDAPEPAPASGRVVTELEEVCAQLRTQGDRLGLTPSRRLWLEPLPEVLRAPDNDGGLVHEPGALRATLGLLDDPARQLQAPWSVDLGESGHLLVVGARGTGKTTTMRQLATALSQRFGPQELHLYGIESGAGSLKPLEPLPHCGGIVAAADQERLHRVFSRLTRAMEQRRTALAASAVGDFNTWRRTLGTPEPWLLLLIDDYIAFKEVADGSNLGSLNDQLLSLAHGGAAVGIHLAVSASQASDMRVNLTNLFGARVLHRQVDAADYALLDLRLRPHELPPSIPGRALVEGGFEVQVFQSETPTGEPTDTPPATAQGPARIERLPREIVLADLLDGYPVDARQAVIGVGGSEYDRLVLDLDRAEQHVAILGEGRSGRSTTLLTLYESLKRCDPNSRFLVLSPRTSPLVDLADDDPQTRVATSPDGIEEALHSLGQSGTGQTYLLIDDAESLPSMAGDALERLLRDGVQLGLRAFVAARTADLARSFDGWARYLLSLRSGLLLTPGVDAGAALDVRLPVSHVPMTPGRGYLCQRGEIELVQIALPR